MRSNISFGEILQRTAHAGFGFVIAILALMAVPLPGISFPFGIAVALGGGQMLLGFDQPWVPRRIRNHIVTIKTLIWLSHKVSRWTHGLEKLIRPRGSFCTRQPFLRLVGAGLIIQGLGLALPIPVPGSNWIFIIPIMFYATGLLEDDGFLIGTGHLFCVGYGVLLVVFWKNLSNAIQKIW